MKFPVAINMVKREETQAHLVARQTPSKSYERNHRDVTNVGIAEDGKVSRFKQRMYTLPKIIE